MEHRDFDRDTRDPAERAADLLYGAGKITAPQWLNLTRPLVLARMDVLIEPDELAA